ncbi:MAG: hypothetical protein HKN19_18775 [Halioglobus sp.]|nr:hypothetical protein [Halioglobus sp.]
MIPWRAVRILCSILLLAPLVHVVYIISTATLATLDASPETWNKEIAAYVEADASVQLPENPIVVTGGQRAKLWFGLEDVLAPHPVLMRGLGDAIIEDISYHYERLVGFYRPHAVVLLLSQSEFFIRDSKSPEDLLAAVQQLVALDENHDITHCFYIFAPIKSPARPQDHGTIEAASRLLVAWAEDLERVKVLEVNPLLAGPSGTPRARYFRSDGMNLNEHGYLRLAVMLQERLERDREHAEQG